MSERTFDVVVIGSGPAGLAAAAAAAEAGLSAVSIDRMGPGGQLMNLGELQGVDGLEPGATGPDLIAQLAEKAMSAGVELAIDDVQRAVPKGDGWLVEALEDSFEARALVIAAGLSPGTTGLADEARFEGMGLSHCAHCDAPLYAGRPVLVAGDCAWTIEEAIHLAGHASEVTIVSTRDDPAPSGRMASLAGLPNASHIRAQITSLHGESTLERIVVEAGDGSREIEAHGLFLYTGRQPAHGFLEKEHHSGAGLFWAGDVRPGAEQTIAEAIADGARAGQNAANWVKAR
jgi:thioredoxin reductase (NADPH)